MLAYRWQGVKLKELEMAFCFTHGGNEFRVEFQQKVRSTRSLLKNGILRPRKSKAKQTAEPPTRQCVDCRIVATKVTNHSGVHPDELLAREAGVVIATGMGVCSPLDSFDVKEGQKWALKHAISRARTTDSTAQLRGVPLTADVTTDLWDAFHKSHTPDAHAARKRGLIRRKGF